MKLIQPRSPKKTKPSHIPSTSIINKEGRIEDKVDYPFVNDLEVIGGWKSVDFVRNIEDFDPTKTSWKGDLFLNCFIFQKDGKVKGNFLAWTKGLVISKHSKTASKYTVKKINGSDYMFYEWKSGDYTIRHSKPCYYVLTKVLLESIQNETMFGKKAFIPPTSTINKKGHIIDKVDYPFVSDPAVLGKWTSVDFVEHISQFNPAKKRWNGNLFLAAKNFLKDGKIESVLNKEKGQITCTDKWTKGLVMDKDTASKYIIKKINGSEYMFFEWKSGDYRFRHRKPSYYVLIKTQEEPKASPIKLQGRVIGIDGSPVTEACVVHTKRTRAVFVGTSDKHAVEQISDFNSHHDGVKTNGDGKFDLGNWPKKKFQIAVTHKSGCAIVTSDEFAKERQIKLQPWASIKGRIANGKKAHKGKVRLIGFPGENWYADRVRLSYTANCDEDGNFFIDRIAPGWYEAGYLSHLGEGHSYTRRTPIIIKPGKVADVTIGAKGRTVIGKFVTPDWYKGKIYFGKGKQFLFARKPNGKRPQDLKTQEDVKWLKAWEFDKWYSYMIDVKEDGTFKIEDVLPGGYRIIAGFDEEQHKGRIIDEIARFNSGFDVYPENSQNADFPVNLGELVLKMRNVQKPGDAPK